MSQLTKSDVQRASIMHNQDLLPINTSAVRERYQDESSIKDIRDMFPDSRCQVLIVGAGWGGLLYAVRMIEAGVRPEDIRIIDLAGGFGGTWYYNRYPGLSCDIESYLYLPLLEETGYVPRHRYSSGEEIRTYANLVAATFKLDTSACFLTRAEELGWEETTKEWRVALIQHKAGKSQTLSIRARFVAMVNGVLNWPKLPDVPGLLDFHGDIFHSSRWDYSVTGGTPQDPSLHKLQDKRVAIIGTGASAVQISPYVARWAKHLYIVQRTPAAVDEREQWETDSERFRKEVATGPGWQRERSRNFHQHFTTAELPERNLVDDGWTRAQGMVPIAGNPDPRSPKSPEELPAYLELLNAIDIPRQSRIRARVDELVSDLATAAKLKPWYPTWCKRPCFHDSTYFDIFNRPNVTLLSNTAGLTGLTSSSILTPASPDPISVDLIIFATGYRPPYGGTPAEKANLRITGRNNLSMTDAWARHGPSTLHGILDHNFPNLFLSGPWQASISGNFLFNDDALARHSAYVLTEAMKKAEGKVFSIVPKRQAVEEWGIQVLMRSATMAAILGCTPSYFNLEGMLDQTPPEEQIKVARSGLWGHGIEDFLEHIAAWRDEGSMKGIEIEL